MPAWIAGIQGWQGCFRRHPCQPGFHHSMLEWRTWEGLCLQRQNPERL